MQRKLENLIPIRDVDELIPIGCDSIWAVEIVAKIEDVGPRRWWRRGRRDGKGGLSPRTVRHHHVTLHTALQSAVKWGFLTRNPAGSVDAPRPRRQEMHTLDEDGMATFLEAARETPYYALFYLALYTGMRRSELLALRWSDRGFFCYQ
ncbi:MAG TPA: hypothetical protein EYO17_06130 [Dehalococcoidia bacterium]|nr:hypothetical protein [Dehalococcoidia bacterium]